jgi:hypothetical protein
METFDRAAGGLCRLDDMIEHMFDTGALASLREEPFAALESRVPGRNIAGLPGVSGA